MYIDIDIYIYIHTYTCATNAVPYVGMYVVPYVGIVPDVPNIHNPLTEKTNGDFC